MRDGTRLDYSRLPHNSILCMDMKAFYASIEAVERGLDPLSCYLAVVGDRDISSSVVLAASPRLKQKYGIRTGSRHYEIPEAEEIVVVGARMGLYLEKSMAVTRILNHYLPLDAIHVYSIDEAWLKLDGTELLHGPELNLARRIKARLREELQLPCSMGLGPNMFLAKVAMDVEGKRCGLAVWNYEDVPAKLWPLELEECWGIGGRLAHHLRSVGARTVGDLARLPLQYLEDRFGIMGTQLYYHAWGVDLSQPRGSYTFRPKSVGRGITLMRDYRGEEVKTVLLELCEEVARRARKKEVAGKTVSLTLIYSLDELRPGFSVQRTREDHTQLAGEIYDLALELMRENYTGQAVRRMSLTLGNLVCASALQLDLCGSRRRELRLAEAADSIRDRYGSTALLRARSLLDEATAFEREDTIGGHRT